ncbi:MAG: M15 family metallopeptidase [Spirochaetia bacterium]|nr:M15 family metallopeptidase [Spirochaetia bacterium]
MRKYFILYFFIIAQTLIPMLLPAENLSFYSEPITDDIFARIDGRSYKEGCPVALEDLRYLHILHKNLEGESLEGEMICNEVIAEKLLDIFEKLYDAGYPIERMVLVDEYDADDELSMTDNNTSCFNFRPISGTSRISLHGYGLAVDINPLYNPCVTNRNGEMYIEPAAGVPYTDRTKEFDYKIDENDLCYKLFTDAGFKWGGSWSRVKDYQHFQYCQ